MTQLILTVRTPAPHGGHTTTTFRRDAEFQPDPTDKILILKMRTSQLELPIQHRTWVPSTGLRYELHVHLQTVYLVAQEDRTSAPHAHGGTEFVAESGEVEETLRFAGWTRQ